VRRYQFEDANVALCIARRKFSPTSVKIGDPASSLQADESDEIDVAEERGDSIVRLIEARDVAALGGCSQKRIVLTTS
jgi:hypothetical protein